MNAGGIVVVIAGLWLGCQIFGGDMIERLGMIQSSKNPPYVPPGHAKPGSYTAPAGGGSNQPIWT